MKGSGESGEKVIATNRKARHEYAVLDTVEAGIVLKGTEVKSLRQGNVNFGDGYATIKNGEVWLLGMHVSPYERGSYTNVDPLRDRKLLLHKTEIRKLLGPDLWGKLEAELPMGADHERVVMTHGPGGEVRPIGAEDAPGDGRVTEHGDAPEIARHRSSRSATVAWPSCASSPRSRAA